MEFKVNKEMLMGGLTVAKKLGKAIVIEGTKAVVLNAAATAIKTSFDEGFEGVKNLTFDEYIEGKDKKKKAKKVNIFGKKNKDEEEVVVEILEADGSKVTK